jgi:hypothetical protein
MQMQLMCCPVLRGYRSAHRAAPTSAHASYTEGSGTVCGS